MESFMEVGQGLNWGSSAQGKKYVTSFILLEKYQIFDRILYLHLQDTVFYNSDLVTIMARSIMKSNNKIRINIYFVHCKKQNVLLQEVLQLFIDFY
jgi:hypothetical protein